MMITSSRMALVALSSIFMTLLLARSGTAQNNDASLDDGDLSTGLIDSVPFSPDSNSPAASPVDDPKKPQFSDPRLQSLFGNRSRRPGRLANPTHLVKPRPTLPSFIRGTPPVQPVTFPTPVTPRPPFGGQAVRVARTTEAPAPRGQRGSRTTRTSSSTTPSPGSGSAQRRSRARDALAASGVLPNSSDATRNNRRFGGTSNFRSANTTPRSRSR